MTAISVIFWRETLVLWRSPLAWTLMGLFSLLAGWTFFNLLVGYADNIQALPADMHTQISFIEEVVMRLYGNFNFFLLFFIPPVTMKLFSEEKKTGTLDLLFGAPVTDLQIVVAKFLAIWVFVWALLLPTIFFPVVLLWAGIPDVNIILGAYAGLVLNSACYVALGLLASALTENQVIAALLGLLFIMSTWLLSWMAQTTDNFLFSQILHWLSVTGHFENLVRGIFSTADVAYYCCFIILSLKASTMILGSRNW